MRNENSVRTASVKGAGLSFIIHHSSFIIGCFIAALATGGAAAQAPRYPDKPVRLVVGFPPGGAADILGRIAAAQLTQSLGEQVVVDNRGGAGGLVATEIAARAVPDGYTFCSRRFLT
jgi:tripartite-type tricarboxylate transporter receptor subunit TctC